MKRSFRKSAKARYSPFIVLITALLFIFQANGQNITKVEYFVDTDPGFGSGSNVTVTPAANIDNLQFTIGLGSVQAGFHTLYVRAKDENGRWSLSQVKAFYKSEINTVALPDITKAEYFIDTDPGFGSGSNIPVTPSTNISNLQFNIGLGAVPAGFHTLYVRAKDGYGHWSLSQVKMFYKAVVGNTVTLPDITKAEFFIDTDPGFGSGTNIPVTPSANINNLQFTVGLGAVPGGFHTLYVRAKDGNGRWSLTLVKAFYKSEINTIALPDVTKVEYFFDNDPGRGMGTNVPVTPGTNISNLSFVIDIDTLPLGTHTLWIRSKDGYGRWSQVVWETFTQDGAPVSVTITASANPVCAGNTVTFTATPVNGGTNPSFQWKLNGQNVGSNKATYSYIPLQNDMVLCILTSSLTNVVNNPATSNTITMTVNSTPLPTIIGATPVCSGITGVIYTTESGKTGYSWSISWGGVITGGNSTNSISVTWDYAGSQTVSVNYNEENGCSAPSPTIKNVTVNQTPSPTITGPASACQGVAGIIYTTESGMSGYSWSVSSGGTITGGTNANAIEVTWNDLGAQTVSVNYTGSNECNNPLPSLKNVTVNPVIPVSITIGVSANPICQGTMVSFTATPANGGTSPFYRWKVNGSPAGTNSPSYSYMSSDNDIVTCELTSNLLCTTGNPATSAGITMAVNSHPAAPVSGGNQSVCSSNLPATLTANAPSGSTVDWYSSASGGALLLENSSTYTTSTPGTYYAESVNLTTGCKSTDRTGVNLTIGTTIQYFRDLDGDGYGDSEVWEFACDQPAGYVANNLDCNDNNPDIHPGAQYFAYTGNPNFTGSIVFPATGSPSTLFHFEADYFDATNSLPAAGYPRLMLDYEGNGSYFDPNDRIVIMTASDPTDLTTLDGKRYFAEVNNLPYGSSWTAKIIVGAGGVCSTTFGPFNYPDVLHQPNLYLFANDITINPPHPDPSQNITVSAVVHNESDFDAQNFVCHLINQWDYTIIYPDITVTNLQAHQNTTIVWNITTPAVPAWCPMQVIVDYTDVIAENDELDNSAVRPFVNGNYQVAGAIVVQSTVSPAVSYSNQYSYLSFSGRAWYTDLAIQLPDSSVAGATIEFQITELPGTTYSGYTNSWGYFSTYFTAPVPPGIYHITGTVTDFTLTGNFTNQFTILTPIPPPPPELKPNLTLNYCHSVDVSPVNPHLASSVNLVAYVVNNGNETATGPIEVQFTYSSGGTWTEQFAGDLAPGQSVAITHSGAPLPPTGTTLTTYADPNDLVTEWNESAADNSTTDNMCFDFQPVSICGGEFWGTYCLPQQGSLSISLYIGLNVNHLYDANPVDVKFEVSGPGITGWQTVGTGTLNNATRNCYCPYVVACPDQYTFTQLGTYTFRMTVDPDNDYPECNESNNVLEVTVNIVNCVPPPPPDHKPNLAFYSCHPLEVQPVNPFFPGMTTLVANIINNGDSIAGSPINVSFTYSTGGTYSGQFNGNLNPGQSVAVSVTAPLPAPATTVLTASIDPANTIHEWNETDNTISDNMCWDFQPVGHCGVNFWSRTYRVGQSASLSVGLIVQHLYDANPVKVRFEVSGPGITGTQDLGNGILNNVTRNCNCPWVVLLPDPFTFFESGTYHFTMTADPDDDYIECDEGNNVLEVDVLVTDGADMRILSQYINPTPLNPDVNGEVTLVVNYENLGNSNVNDQMKLRIKVDTTVLEDIYPVYGLATGDHTSIAIPNTWSSNLAGAHVIRAIIDADNQVAEINETNNEATRAIIVGEAANLYFQLFASSESSPGMGDYIQINARIGNNGDVNATANVKFYYVDDSNDTIQIGQQPVSVFAHDSVPLIMPWVVADNQTTLIGKITDVNTLEFNPDDNVAIAIIGGLDISITSTTACYQENNGTLNANVTGGTAPFLYVWSNGYIGQTLTAGAGNFSVTVTDNTGNSTLASGIISADPATIAGEVTESETIFIGIETTLNLEGNVGSVLKWQKRWNGGPWQDISETGPTYTEVPDATGTWDYWAEVRSGNCETLFSNYATVIVQPVTRTINLTLFLEGLYNPATNQMNKAQDVNGDKFPGTIADKIQIQLAKPTYPFSVYYSVNDVNLNQDGTCTITIPRSGNYYLVVRHRNSIETWSSTPVSLLPETISYDFSTAASQAYGSNLKPVGTAYAIYGGDVTQDGFVDGSDMAAVDNGSTAVLQGYNPQDINGDGIVDGSDMAIVDNNSTAVVQAKKP